MNLITLPCLRCGIEPVTIPEAQKIVGGICEHCIHAENKVEQERVMAEQRQRKWESICPELYQDTVFDRLPHPKISQRALRWPYMIKGAPDKAAPWMGLNLWGWQRTGKTRSLYLIVKKAYFDGKTVAVFGPSQFAQGCESRAFNTASWIRHLVSLDILGFDDIDKCKLTKPQEEKFFALLDARIARRAPTFFTGNTPGDDLKLQFRNGEAVLARMREHSVSIHFPQQQSLQI